MSWITRMETWMNERYTTESFGEAARQLQADRDKQFEEQQTQFLAEQDRRKQLAKERAGLTPEQRRLAEKAALPEAYDE